MAAFFWPLGNFQWLHAMHKNRVHIFENTTTEYLCMTDKREIFCRAYFLNAQTSLVECVWSWKTCKKDTKELSDSFSFSNISLQVEKTKKTYHVTFPVVLFKTLISIPMTSSRSSNVKPINIERSFFEYDIKLITYTANVNTVLEKCSKANSFMNPLFYLTR